MQVCYDGSFGVDTTGITRMKIAGLCSSREALQPVEEEVVHRMAEYIQQQLAKR